MATPTYRSWIDYARSASRQDGQEFTESSRAQMRSVGTDFLVHVSSTRSSSVLPGTINDALRDALIQLDAAAIETYLSGVPESQRSQHRSVLRLYVRPWLEKEKLLPANALPEPEKIHPSDALFDGSTLPAQLGAAIARNGSTAASAGNVVRIVKRFWRFTHDVSAVERLPNPEEKTIALLAALTGGFDALVQRFSMYQGQNPTQPSKAASQSVRSALNRFFRPLILGAAPLPESERPERPKSLPPRREPRAPKASSQASATSAPDTVATMSDSSSTTTAAPVSPQPAAPVITHEAFKQSLSAALSLLSQKSKAPINELHQLGVNDVRLEKDVLRVFLASASPRVPGTWVRYADVDLRRVIDQYLGHVRLLKLSRSKFFVEYGGKELVVPTKNKKR